MKSLRFLALTSAALVAGTGLLIACGDDDVVLLNVGEDSGSDASRVDGSRADGSNVPDVTTPDADDAGPDPDADAGIDAGDDAGEGDGGTTFFDASTFDAGPDAGFTPDAGPAAVILADVFCNTVARCCFGNENLGQGAPLPGGGTFNRQKCVANYTSNGFEQSTAGSSVNPSHVIVSQTGSALCAERLKSLTCSLGFTEFAAVRQACYGALLGTQGPGQACTVSAECQAGLFCNNPTTGADAGKCEAVRATGANCGDFTTDQNTSQHACSYRYSGEPPRFCEWVNLGTGQFLPPADWRCRDALPNGADCASSPWCASGICDFDTNKCVATSTYFATSDCNQYRTP